ncbi:hypothetical protein CTAYLR_004075 [Chrysophaeum taylorii]|uniref:DNA polymerase n=1 Tax=Chrysophaeum taylorii TaxID=2483200 RepID=A0AAD7UPP5_9STRA|nr:hypothetical protein CTAYLR_004075 [Chrysophaeum taylorii]
MRQPTARTCPTRCTCRFCTRLKAVDAVRVARWRERRERRRMKNEDVGARCNLKVPADGPRKRVRVFEGCVVVLEGLGKRGEQMRKRIEERGGRTCAALEEATHVVVGGSTMPAEPTTGTVVTDAWVVESLAKEALQSTEKFEVVDARFPRKRLRAEIKTKDFGIAKKFACQREPEYRAQHAQRSAYAARVEPVFREILGFMERSTEVVEREFKSRAYGKAIGRLERSEKALEELSREELAAELGPQCGKQMLKHIDQILSTGECDKLVALRQDPRRAAVRDLSQVWGIGPVTALKLYVEYDVKTVNELRDLVKNQPTLLQPRVCRALECYEDLLERMPRDEADQIRERAVAAAKRACGDVIADAAGSFRRGKLTCGDVDVLVAKRDWETNASAPRDRTSVLETIVEDLHAQGFLTHDLTDVTRKRSRPEDEGDERDQSFEARGAGPATYMGICKIRAKHRRIDIKVYDPAQLPFALLYFTGSDHFNRSMRYYAKKIGYSLSDQGLYERRPDGTKGRSIACKSEREVFEKLGLEFREPYERGVDVDRATVDAAKQRLQAEGRLGQEHQHLNHHPAGVVAVQPPAPPTRQTPTSHTSQTSSNGWWG